MSAIQSYRFIKVLYYRFKKDFYQAEFRNASGFVFLQILL